MSQRFPGGFITKTPTAPTSSSAPGIWTLDQAMQNQKAGNWPSPPSPYIEDWFSTYLYTGNGSTQTITNGIDLAGKGGLVWLKSRSGADPHELTNTVQGTSNSLRSNSANGASSTDLTGFTSSGFTLGYVTGNTNLNGATEVSWTFAKRQKFFDIVTWTGDGNTSKVINHNLGSTPGCIIVKNLTTAQDWLVYHTSLGNTQALFLDLTSAAATSTAYWNNTSPTSTNFTVGISSRVNESGSSFVAYLFANNAGGFGATGSDNVISCGSFTTDSGGNTTSDVNLGYEPQWLLAKPSSGVGDWQLFDNMRGLPVDNGAGSGAKVLYPNTSAAEASTAGWNPTSTGFKLVGGAGGGAYTFIYIAIRRGPMKVPTTGTSVFTPVARAGNNNVATSITSVGFPPDFSIVRNRDIGGVNFEWDWQDRLRGIPYWLDSSATTTETYNAQNITTYNMTGVTFGTESRVNGNSAQTYINYFMRRAPNFFDEVCYTGTGSTLTLTHNLGVAPELLIAKKRNAVNDWYVLFPAGGSSSRAGYLDADNGFTGASATVWGDGSAYVAPTSTQVTVGSYYSGSNTAVMYLFATCPGVSKVGSYTGTAALLTVNCGFTSGARFVLIKRTDTVGDWYVYDSARGISSGNDPYLLINSTAAEVTGTNYVDTDTTGFKVTAAAPAGLNANGGTYIFLAIA